MGWKKWILNVHFSFFYAIFAQHIFTIQLLLFLTQLIFLEWENPLPFHSIKYSKINTKVRERFTLWLRTSHCHVHSGRMQYCLAKITSRADCLSHIFCSQGYMESGVCSLAYVLCDILGKTDAQPLKNEICLIFKTVFKSCHLILRKQRIAHLNSCLNILLSKIFGIHLLTCLSFL